MLTTAPVPRTAAKVIAAATVLIFVQAIMVIAPFAMGRDVAPGALAVPAMVTVVLSNPGGAALTAPAVINVARPAAPAGARIAPPRLRRWRSFSTERLRRCFAAASVTLRA